MLTILVALVLSIAAVPAFAARSFESDINGTPEGAFSNPWGLAVDGSDNLWVGDLGPGDMDKFDPSGTFLAKGTGGGNWGGSYVRGLSFSNASGHLYIGDSNFDDVWVIDSSGGFLSDIKGPWGEGCCYVYTAADNSGGASDGSVYVSASAGTRKVYKLSGAGSAVPFSGSAAYISGNELTGTPAGDFGSPFGITTDADGNIYVIDAEKNEVDEFAPSGVFVQRFSGTPEPFGSIAGVAVDPTSGDVLIADGAQAVVHEFDSSGAFGEDLTGIETAAGSLGAIQDIEIDSSGILYVSDGANAVVNVFGPNLVLPKVTYSPVTGLTRTSAILHATVDPNAGGDVSACHYEYGVDTGYASGSIACTPTAPYSTTTEVTADLSGLTSGTTYHYRVVVVNPNGTKKATDRTFVTLPAVTATTTEAATGLTGNAATLNGSFEGDGREIHYYFEWGEDEGYGKTTTVADAGSPATLAHVSTGISGLKPESTYHFRFVASNADGVTRGEDQAFLTPPAVTGLTTDAPSDVTQTSATLNGSFAGNGDDTHYYFEWGPDTQYGNVTALAPGADAGSPSGQTTVSAGITGLAMQLPTSTPYHYRIVATNSAGTTVGPDRAFYAAAPSPPTVSGTAVTAVTPTTATVGASINPQLAITVYHFQYGETSDYGAGTPYGPSIGSDGADHHVGGDITGLRPGTTYHFRVVAVSFGGTTHGADMTFSTPSPPVVNETAVSEVGQTAVTLSAQISPGFLSTTYRFEYGTGVGNQSSTAESTPLAADNASHPATVTLSGLEPGTTYHFHVVATNALGSTTSPDLGFATQPRPAAKGPPACKRKYVRRHGRCVKRRKHRRHAAHPGVRR